MLVELITDFLSSLLLHLQVCLDLVDGSPRHQRSPNCLPILPAAHLLPLLYQHWERIR